MGGSRDQGKGISEVRGHDFLFDICVPLPIYLLDGISHRYLLV